MTDWRAFNHEQLDHHQGGDQLGRVLGELRTSGIASLQNWQSEFLAIGTMAVFTIYLRQRGSPESKPVGAPHDATGESS